MAENRQFVVTKRIAKQGSQSMILIPKALESQLKPRTLVKVTVDILEEGK